MMNSVIYVGICDEGPLTGQRLAKDRTRYRLTAIDMRLLLATDMAHHRWPLDTDEHRALRDAYIAGATEHEGVPLKIIEGQYQWDGSAWRWSEGKSA